MKKLSQIKLTARLVIATGVLNAQDTICFKTNEKIAAKVVEIDINTISYKLTDNLNETNYVTNKKAILFIKFSNGKVDTIESNGYKSQTSMVEPQKNIISSSKNRLTLNGKILNDNDLKNLIDTCNNAEKKKELQTTFDLMNRYRKNRKIIAPIILASGFVVPIITTGVSFDSSYYKNEQGTSPNKFDVFISGVIGGAVVRTSAYIIAKMNKNKYLKQRNEIAKMYNQMP